MDSWICGFFLLSSYCPYYYCFFVNSPWSVVGRNFVIRPKGDYMKEGLKGLQMAFGQQVTATERNSVEVPELRKAAGWTDPSPVM